MLTIIKVYACYTVKIYKNKPTKCFKPGDFGEEGALGAPLLDPPLD